MACLALAGCSLGLDFDQCQTDDGCDTGSVCVEHICKPPERVEVDEFVVDDTTWTADHIYVLDTVIAVVPPATLTIEPGTRILGKQGTALVVRAGARLRAQGTRQAPIVFSSAKPVGQRLAGDWGGVALIGNARVNRPDFYLNIITGEEEAKVGGTDDSWDCGSLKYVRIEFGGGEVAGEEALNGLTLAGCGSETDVDYVQVHQGEDDCLEIFGGTVDIRHVILTRAHDDTLDIDTGWRGTAQFLVTQQDLVGNHAIEVDNLYEDPTATPLTDFSIYNYTLVGGVEQGDVQRAISMRKGGAGTFSHGIITGQTTEAINIGGAVSAQRATDGDTAVKNTLFYDVGDGGSHYFPSEPEPTDDDGVQGDGGFDEAAFFEQESFNNLFDLDPGLKRPHDLANPSFVPSPENTTSRELEPPPGDFDPTAVYRGAFAPNADPWTEDWTDFPKN